MPLGSRGDCGDARFCGLEIGYPDDIADSLSVRLVPRGMHRVRGVFAPRLHEEAGARHGRRRPGEGREDGSAGGSVENGR